MSSASPDTSACRGPLFERLAPFTSRWQEINGYRVSAQLRTRIAPGAPWLCDFTHLRRVGFKGRGAAAWLQAQGLVLPDSPNRWLRDIGGATIARLGAEDFLITDEPETISGLAEDLTTRWHTAGAPGGFPVPRQHGLAAFVLGGERAAELLAHLCAVDLRPKRFAGDAIAQTQLALSSVVIMRSSIAAAASYRVFVDTSLALYLWDVLHDVATALGGGALGCAQQLGD